MDVTRRSVHQDVVVGISSPYERESWSSAKSSQHVTSIVAWSRQSRSILYVTMMCSMCSYVLSYEQSLQSSKQVMVCSWSWTLYNQNAQTNILHILLSFRWALYMHYVVSEAKAMTLPCYACYIFYTCWIYWRCSGQRVMRSSMMDQDAGMYQAHLSKAIRKSGWLYLSCPRCALVHSVLAARRFAAVIV
jgi:hypothetical protein